MRNWGGVKVFVQATLICLSSILIVDVGMTEFLAPILLYCGMLHMTRMLEGERNEVTKGESRDWRLEVKRKMEQESMCATRLDEGKEERVCGRCQGSFQPQERQRERSGRKEDLQGGEGYGKPGAGEKGGGKFYAVLRGRQAGIYRNWEDCRLQVEGYSRARFKSFWSLREAKNFMGM